VTPCLIKGPTHTGVFPDCERVTRIDMVVVVVARSLRGGWVGKMQQRQGAAGKKKIHKRVTFSPNYIRGTLRQRQTRSGTKCERRVAVFVDVLYKF
jgi:hypothetical protein